MAKILIVDDDIDLLEGQKILLQEHGYVVETATGLQEGLTALKDFKPDVIVADLMMEHIDSGIVFCNKIRQDPELSDIPIIMQTASADKTGFSLARNYRHENTWLKADEVVSKPVSLDVLREIIERYISKDSRETK